jgi:uncharacterized protein YukE
MKRRSVAKNSSILTVTYPHIEKVEKKIESASRHSHGVRVRVRAPESRPSDNWAGKAANNATSSQQSNTTHSPSKHSAHYHYHSVIAST